MRKAEGRTGWDDLYLAPRLTDKRRIRSAQPKVLLAIGSSCELLCTKGILSKDSSYFSRFDQIRFLWLAACLKASKRIAVEESDFVSRAAPVYDLILRLHFAAIKRNLHSVSWPVVAGH